jgi:hypothetical protein
VLIAASSVSADHRHAFRVALVDSLTKGSAGTYPWRLRDSESTVVYLKNVTDRPMQYSVQIDFDGGAYVLGLRTLDPGRW